MSYSPYRYIVLYAGCDTPDIVYCEEFGQAVDEMKKMETKVKKMGITERPYIEIYVRNEKGDYVFKDVYNYRYE